MQLKKVIYLITFHDLHTPHCSNFEVNNYRQQATWERGG